jgi:signal transduction histidine kinase
MISGGGSGSKVDRLRRLFAMTNTTILRVARDASAREAAGVALRDAGFRVLDVETLERAAEALQRGEAEFLVCDAQALSERAGWSLPNDAARALSHDLRTPLSAMAGWLHLIESGKLDSDGLKRAIVKLQANIEDQVRTIDRYLGANREGQR